MDSRVPPSAGTRSAQRIKLTGAPRSARPWGRWASRSRIGRARSWPRSCRSWRGRVPWRPAVHRRPPAAAALSGRPPDWTRSSPPGSRQRDITTWRLPPETAGGHRRACLCGHAEDRPLPLSRAQTRPGTSLGQRGGRMAPLRCGTGDPQGAVSGDCDRRHARDALHRSASRREIYLDSEVTAGSPITEDIA
jgi:hypothetical protein